MLRTQAQAVATRRVGRSHDAITLLSGHNVITGEDVGLGGRLIAPVGVLTPATGGEIRAGFGAFKEVKAAVKGMGLEVHHIIEKRFAALLGKDAREMLSVALPRELHQQITNLWRNLIPYGKGTANATREQREAAAGQIYEATPEILNAAKQELKQ